MKIMQSEESNKALAASSFSDGDYATKERKKFVDVGMEEANTEPEAFYLLLAVLDSL